MDIISRLDAIALGLVFYNTGEPCQRGHYSKRSVKKYQCCECKRIDNLKYVKNKPYYYYIKLSKFFNARSRGTTYKNKGGRIAYLSKEQKLINNKLSNKKSKEKRKEQRRLYDKLWRKNNKERRKAQKHTRRKNISSGGKFTHNDVLRIFQMQNAKCAYCRKSIKKIYHIDHIKPIALGGSNVASNIQLTCPKCNLKKSSKDPIVYARETGRLL